MEFNRYRLPGLEHTFGRGPRNHGFLVMVDLQKKSADERQEDELEARELARASATKVLGSMHIFLPQPNPSHFLKKGKQVQLKEQLKRLKANILIMNVDLSPTQAGNLESFIGMPVVDRSGLILEIFSRRATSRAGQIQVELAQLKYALPRLRGLGTVMSRLGGGIGTRGPGEQELERDRRKVRQRIERVKRDLKKLGKHRDLIRQGRKRKRFLTAALVGYTNAGKSTLLNVLTRSGQKVQDQLFATLDPKVRLESTGTNRKLLFVDTVGFLKDLPHSLIEAFHSTLEEVIEADFLIHVLDISHRQARAHFDVVTKVLTDIKADHLPILLALNKSEDLSEQALTEAENTWPDGIFISAKNKLGISELRLRIKQLSTSLHISI